MQEGISGFLKRLAATGADYLVSLTQFESDVREDYHAIPIAEAGFYYQAGGDTNLFDGIGLALEREENTTDPTVVFIFSDGEAGNSYKYTEEQVGIMVRARVNLGNWTFVWMNMQGSRNSTATKLLIETFDFQQKDIIEVMAAMAERLAASVARMRLAGANRVDVAALLGERRPMSAGNKMAIRAADAPLVERWGYVHQVNPKTGRLQCGQAPPKSWEEQFIGEDDQIDCQGCLDAMERDREWQAAYRSYIDSKPWELKSSMALEHNRLYQHGICQGCFVRPATQVHHLNYPRGSMPGDAEWLRQEKFWMLKTVCDECHKDMHPHMREQNNG
jgi:hypothetical protein